MNLIEEIKIALKSHIESYFYGKGKSRRYHPLDELLPVERKIRSVIGGIETSMGTSFWPLLAKRISYKNKFKTYEVTKQEIISVPEEAKKYIDFLVESKKTHESDGIILNTLYDLCGQKGKTLVEIKDTIEKSMVYLQKGRNRYLFIFRTVYPSSNQKSNDLRLVLSKYIINYLSRGKDSDFQCIVVYPYEIKNSKKDNSFYVRYGEEFWDKIIGLDGTYNSIISGFKELKNNDVFVKYIKECIEKS